MSFYEKMVEAQNFLYDKQPKPLFKGIFWIVDIDNVSCNKNYCFKIPCDIYGVPEKNWINDIPNDNDTYNHKLHWSLLREYYP
jgi:hypothetical protein